MPRRSVSDESGLCQCISAGKRGNGRLTQRRQNAEHQVPGFKFQVQEPARPSIVAVFRVPNPDSRIPSSPLSAFASLREAVVLAVFARPPYLAHLSTPVSFPVPGSRLRRFPEVSLPFGAGCEGFHERKCFCRNTTYVKRHLSRTARNGIRSHQVPINGAPKLCKTSTKSSCPS
jgi:hypothetical protein